LKRLPIPPTSGALLKMQEWPWLMRVLSTLLAMGKRPVLRQANASWCPRGYHLLYFHPKLKLRLITSPTYHTGIGVQYVWQRVERTTLILPIGRRSGQYLFLLQIIASLVKQEMRTISQCWWAEWDPNNR